MGEGIARHGPTLARRDVSISRASVPKKLGTKLNNSRSKNKLERMAPPEPLP
jgi:hypothetical protein